MPPAAIVAQRTSTPLPRPEPPRGVSPFRLALFPARIFLALGWTRAGVEKLIDPDWWTGNYLLEFLNAQQDTALPIATLFTDLIDTRLAIAISFVVLAIELVLGFCLLTGKRLTSALAVACGLNAVFVSLGAVNPSTFYLVLQLTLAMAMIAGRPVVSVTKNAAVIGGCGLFGLTMTPFISTLHPHEVIEDPAIMLATLAMLVAATLGIRLLDHMQSQHRGRPLISN